MQGCCEVSRRTGLRQESQAFSLLLMTAFSSDFNLESFLAVFDFVARILIATPILCSSLWTIESLENS